MNIATLKTAEQEPLQTLAAADALLRQRPILNNPYFVRLRDGFLERDTFARTQIQFFHAVRFFPRAMAALTSRLPDSGSRRGLILNLAEEHGYDAEKSDFIPSIAHDRTFVAFLTSLGITVTAIQPEQAPVRAFNLALLGACQSEPIPLAFASLGIIEYMFADISALIGAVVVQRGWIAPGDLVHYKLHATIDKEHAAEFLESAEGAWEAGGAARQSVEQGLKLGLHLFDQLYSNLLAES